jgi:hypothetical protein
MRWLKFIVILLGLLIVCGVALLGYGFYKKTSEPDWKLFNDPPPPAPSIAPLVPSGKTKGPLPVFGDVKITVPKDCFIRTARPEGKRLYVILGPKETCGRVIVVDITDGRTLGTVSTDP